MTVWNGTFFDDCSGLADITLTHDRFSTSGYHGICNNGAIVAQPHSLRPVEDGIYTSQLHINMTMISILNGSTITCSHYKGNGELIIVGMWTMIGKQCIVLLIVSTQLIN